MTLQPTITASKGANTVLSSSEWNGDVIQQANYLDELLAGTNATKIPGTALAIPLNLSQTVNMSGAGGLNVTAGTTGLQALTATTGSFTGAVSTGGLSSTGGLTVTAGTTGVQALTATSVAATGAVSGNTLSCNSASIGGPIALTGQSVLTGGAVLSSAGSSFTGVPGGPAGVILWTINGGTIKVPYYT